MRPTQIMRPAFQDKMYVLFSLDWGFERPQYHHGITMNWKNKTNNLKPYLLRYIMIYIWKLNVNSYQYYNVHAGLIYSYIEDTL